MGDLTQFSDPGGAVIFALLGFVTVPVLMFLARLLGLYMICHESECVVLELFGTVRMVITEPGLHSPWKAMGPLAALVPIAGRKHVIDMRLDQTYLRSEAVNSEEGAPMGIGVWYEMKIKDPVDYLYKNADPAGSLRANVSNAAVRSLSNMKLERMLVDRHEMSRSVREEVGKRSGEWGYEVGSVYVRKVHFRDVGMIRQIEQKVVNRLRQVTAAIQQDGANRVNVIRSTAERQAAVEFARAAAIRPEIVGNALAEINSDPVTADALFDILETQRLLANPELKVTRLPANAPVILGPDPG